MTIQRVLALGLCALILAGGRWAGAQNSVPGVTIQGETWTCKDGDNAPLAGILLKPEGEGPFPAIIISHGMGGSAESFAMQKAREMVKWGFVCIGTNYTHAGRGEFTGVRRPGQGSRPASGPASGIASASGPASRPKGRAGVPRDAGASPENLRRARKCIEILKSLPYVDQKRICAYGNSMGAFLTVALAADALEDIAAAAITAGGVRPGKITVQGAAASPTFQTAESIRCPFIIFHGTADGTVRPEMSAALKAILDKNNVPNERVLFEGVGHNAHADKADEFYSQMRDFFIQHGILKSEAKS